MKRFTLMELITVTALLAILVSILLPSLLNARSRAMQAVCMNNLSQIHRGMSQYRVLNDHKLWSLPEGRPGGAIWDNVLMPFMGYDDYRRGMMTYSERPSVMICTETPDEKMNTKGAPNYAIEVMETWGHNYRTNGTLHYIDNPDEYIIFADSNSGRIRPDSRLRTMFGFGARHFRGTANAVVLEGAVISLSTAQISHAGDVSATSGKRLAYGDNPEDKY